MNQQDNQSDERFVAVHINQSGVDELNPELPQIEDIVKPFLPLNYKYLYALNATREIVNGFKYEILFVMENELMEEVYCEMDVLEKPWLVKDTRKFRKLTYSNCSLTNPPDFDDQMRHQYEINPSFVNQGRNLSESDISDMEDQIITTKPRRTTTTTEETVTQADDEEVTLPPLDPSSKNLLDDFFNMNNYFPPPQTTTTTTTTLPPPVLSNDNRNVLDEMFGIGEVEKSQVKEENLSEKTYENVNAAPSRNEADLQNLEMEIKKVFSELFQTDPEFQMNIIALINRKDDTSAHKNYNYVLNILANKLKDRIENYSERKLSDDTAQMTVDPLEGSSRRRRSTGVKIWDLAEQALNTLDHFDGDDEKRILVDILSVKTVENDSLVIEMMIANSNCRENSQAFGKCDGTFDQNSMKICLIEVAGSDGKLTSSHCNPVSRQRRQVLGGLPGGVSDLDVNHPDVKLYLDETLVSINAAEDPDYTVKKILRASTQVVAGSLVKFDVEMDVGSSPVICHFEVWERSWLPDGRKVKVDCDNEKKFTFTQTPVSQRTERTRRDTETNEQDHNGNHHKVVGAPSEIDANDETVNSLLAKHLKRLDAGEGGDLEVVTVESVTKQVVAGLNYKIKGKFRSGSEDAKSCTVDIWTRPWIETDDGTQIKAECDGGVRLKAKRTKRSVRPMPGRHTHEHRETSEMKVREIKSEILFENFIKKYERRYANDLETDMRHRIFKKNLHKIDMLNKHEQGTAKYGITPFADLTEKEYLHKTGLVVPEHRENEIDNPTAEIPDIDEKDLPSEFDWVEKGVVTGVKNQGNCGSCWSFSVTGNIEGLHAVKTGKLEAYSEQELLDCDTKDNACNGGYMDDAFKAIEQIGGLELEDEYPYEAKKQKKCLFNATMSHVKVKGVVDMPKGDEVAMQKYLVSNGPISIGINAAAMQFYRGGVSHPWKILCRKSDLDHGVLLVGYGVKTYPTFNKTLPYWKIKNSWGPKWGEQGYYRIYRGDNSCGVAEMASSAILE